MRHTAAVIFSCLVLEENGVMEKGVTMLEKGVTIRRLSRNGQLHDCTTPQMQCTGAQGYRPG